MRRPRSSVAASVATPSAAAAAEISEETDTSTSVSSSESEVESVHNSTRDRNVACGSSKVQSPEAPLSVSVTLKQLDILDCPICLEPLCPPVYQCGNGHIACASCCPKMKNRCPNCRRVTGTIRCRSLETILEAVTLPCPNTSYGCTETLNYSKRLDHEKTCKFARFSCPFLGCEHLDMYTGLYKHFARLHSNSTKQFVLGSPVSITLDNHQQHVFLQETKRSTIFVLNRTITALGSLVKVVCVGPACAKGSPFFYQLRAEIDGETSIGIKTSVECVAKWIAKACSKRCLVISSDLIVKGQLKLKLKIRKNPALAG